MPNSGGVYASRMGLLFLLMILLSGCSLLESLGLKKKPSPAARRAEPEEQQLPPGIYDIDPKTGVQYYLSEDMVQNHPLPNGTNTQMVLVPGGEFIMGLNDEDPLGIQPAGNIRISVNSFWIDQTEVTNKQYREFLNSLPPSERKEMLPDSLAWAREVGIPWEVYFRGEGYEDYPVVCVTWHQARQFAEWAGKKLPTEVEWEYAARSGVSGRIYPWDGIYARDPYTGSHLANFAPNGDHAVDGFVITAPVGSFPANNFRLYDMAGNVTEWCKDAYFPSYKVLKMTQKQLVTPQYVRETERRKIIRGGSWASDDFFIGVGVRDYRFAKQASPRLGFRCAKPARNPLMLSQAQQGYAQRTARQLNPNRVQINNPPDTAGQAAAQQAAAESESGSSGESRFIQGLRNFGRKFVNFFKPPFGSTQPPVEPPVQPEPEQEQQSQQGQQQPPTDQDQEEGNQ